MGVRVNRAVVLGFGAALTLTVAVTAACSSLDYYRQALAGQMELVRKREPVAEVVDSADTSATLRQRLLLIQRMRDFATGELRLPDNGSYRSYADLGRPYLVWNVFATPELSLAAREWCYPLVGCLSYRGYFDPQQATQLATELQRQGLETWVGGVPAYSTLGWFDDPLLNTFVDWPEGRLAELIFHELAHQRLYLSGATGFNESFATAVGRLGARRWLARYGADLAGADYQRQRALKSSFLNLVFGARTELESVYGSEQGAAGKRQAKSQVLEILSHDYQRWKARWQGFSGYDRVMATGPSNAWFAAVATYTDQVPAFLALFQASGESFERFYRAAERLADLNAETRSAELSALAERFDQSRRASR
jgi:predicted aminopeptidase